MSIKINLDPDSRIDVILPRSVSIDTKQIMNSKNTVNGHKVTIYRFGRLQMLVTFLELLKSNAIFGRYDPWIAGIF